MFVITTIYGIYSICKRTRACIQMQSPEEQRQYQQYHRQQQQQQQDTPQQPVLNNYTPLLPPIIIRCDTYEHIEKESNTSFETCAICLDKYDLTTRVAILENCKHMFHDQCITDWFKRSHHCPMCNA